MGCRRVRVDLNRGGDWEITLAGPGAPLTCETLGEARRTAYLRAIEQRPREMVVCDAYLRVLQRDLLDHEVRRPVMNDPRSKCVQSIRRMID